MPSIRPSRLFSSSWMLSLMPASRRKDAMNLPEPSGSSPPEKPPGRITICALRIEFSSCSALSRRASAEKLRTTTISAAPPAFSTARAVSYSQLVPGNTGITASGFALLTAGAAALRSVKETLVRCSSEAAALVGNTLSSLPSKAAVSSSSVTDSPATVIFSSSVVWPTSQ